MMYQFSPSELDYKPKCRRCFYLLKKHKLSLGNFPPPVFSSFDVVQKSYFLNKNTSDVTDQLPSGKFLIDLPGRITSSNLKDNKGRPYTLFGAPDLVVQFDQGGYGIIDFKTTNLSQTKSDNYKFQLEAYAQIFANPGATKSKTTPKLVPVTHMGIAQFFPTEIFSHAKDECDLKLKMLYSPQPRIEEEFCNLITNLIDLLEESNIPEPGQNCLECNFVSKNIQYLPETELLKKKFLLKEYKGKIINYLELKNIKLANLPHYFVGGDYHGQVNIDNEPHGFGELTSAINIEDKFSWVCSGEWENGVFIKGTYYMPPTRIYEGSFVYNMNDWELHDRGVELHFESEEDYNNHKVMGHVKGVFEKGELQKGDIENASLIGYSERKGINKIIYEGYVGWSKNIHGEKIQIQKGEIYYDDGFIYKGEIDYDLPHGKGTGTTPEGKNISGNWVNGNIDE